MFLAKFKPKKESSSFPNPLESFKMPHTTVKLVKSFYLSVIILGIIALFTACASQKSAQSISADENRLITDVITSEDTETTTVTVKGNQTLTYTAIKQVFPLGILFHFPGTSLDNIKTVSYPPENEFISSIRATQIDENGKTSRIFIALKKDIPYEIEPDANALNIVFPKSGMLTGKKSPAAPPAEDTSTESMPATAAAAPFAAPQPEPAEVKPMVALQKAAEPATRILSISATPLKKNVVITVKADGTITDYKSFTIRETPHRIVYDIYKLKSPFKGVQQIAVKSDQVRKIRHYGHSDKVRIVLETPKAYLSKYTAKPVDNGLLIYVGQSPPPPGMPEPKAVDRSQSAETAAAATAAPKASEKVKPAASNKSSGAVWLNRIEFASEEAGKSAVIIGTTRPVEYQLNKVGRQRLHLKLTNTNLPEYRKRALITTRFQSAVDRITPTYRAESKYTVIDIELREEVPYFVEQTADVIRVNFSPSRIPPRPYEDAKLPAWKQVLADPATKPAAPSAATAPAAAQIEAKRAPETAKSMPITKESPPPTKAEKSIVERLHSASLPEKKYTGEKISLDFFDTDIKNVFRIIREISGKNFAIDKNVTGKVTLTLDKPVPWDQVLDLVLKMNQLGMTMEGDIIRIATLNSLAQEEKLKQAQLKATQQAAKQKKALEPLVTAYIPVSYSNAQSEVLPHIQTVLTEGRGKASVDTRNNQLILTDTAEKIQQIREIVMKIDQVTPQVVIEARIVEANTSFTRDLGFDWGEITAGPFEVGDADLTLNGVASNLPAADPSALVGFDFVKLTGTPFAIIDAKLLVSETEGKTNIISAPKVVTLDNKKAKIKQGLEVPYLERDSSGNATVRFKNVDLLLEVTPNVTPDDRIVMKIFVTKNDVAEQTQDGPALSTNEAETELLIENGDTIVIGGIVKSTITYGEKGIPGLRKIGVLGWLFKSQSKFDAKNELLIFITPRIVQLKQKKGVEI
jgi:type IV pilus assembly protein PilQ